MWSPAFYGAVGPFLARRADTADATHANPDGVANKGIDDVTDHYAKIIDGLPAQPILIGHSFGGLIAEKLLGRNRGAAAIAVDASQIKGVPQLLHHRGIG